LPSVDDKPIREEHDEFAKELFESVEAAFEMTHFGSGIREAEWLTGVHVLFDGSVEERGVDVKLTQLKVLGGRNDK
jgi:hypothetical protein